MMNNFKKISLVEKVVGKLKSGRIKMRPKAYFILKTALIVLGVLVAALFTVYLISFIVFALRASGAWYLPGFGFRGMAPFFVSLPFFLILSAILLIAVLELLVKYFSFVYRRPILYSVLAIIIFTLLGGFILGRTRLHPDFLKRAKEGRLPVAGHLYRDYGMPKFRNMHCGAVSEITQDGFIIRTSGDDVLTVIVTPETNLPDEAEIKENDVVVVLGELKDGAVRAIGVRKIDDNADIFPSPRPFPPSPRPMPGSFKR